MGEIVGAYLMPHPPVIIPEVGKGREKEIYDTIQSMNKVAQDIADKKPDTIILISPHGALFKDAVAIMGTPKLKGQLDEFGAKQVCVEKNNDLELGKEIDLISWSEGIPTVFLDDEKIQSYHVSSRLDHGAMVPLYFVEKAYSSYDLVHINYGLLSKKELYAFGEIISSCVEKSDKKVVIIASGDLSHKLTPDAPAGYNEKGILFDEKLLGLLAASDIEGIFSIEDSLANDAGECGLRSIEMMLGAFEGKNISVEVLSYEGPFGVGYGTAIIVPGERNTGRSFKNKISELMNKKITKVREKEDEYVTLARKALEYFVLHNKKLKLPLDTSTDIIKKKAGVFVSIKEEGELRGCIGTIEATQENIGEEIIRNAIQSGTQDPRFHPVEKNELDKLIYSVDILGEPEPIESKDKLNVKEYGVVVESGSKRGLLLPNLEGVETIDDQISIALEKANIRKGEKYRLYRFKVKRHK